MTALRLSILRAWHASPLAVSFQASSVEAAARVEKCFEEFVNEKLKAAWTKWETEDVDMGEQIMDLNEQDAGDVDERLKSAGGDQSHHRTRVGPIQATDAAGSNPAAPAFPSPASAMPPLSPSGTSECRKPISLATLGLSPVDEYSRLMSLDELRDLIRAAVSMLHTPAVPCEARKDMADRLTNALRVYRPHTTPAPIPTVEVDVFSGEVRTPAPRTSEGQ